jgi:hypothetical protein
MLKKRLDTKVVGFCNLYTGEREDVCDACMRIVVWTRSLDVSTPVPLDCTCRGAVPAGHFPVAKYFPPSTPGIDYEDLLKDGGKKWGLLDWDVLVLSPLDKFLSSNDTCAALPFVAMLRHYMVTKWKVSNHMRELLCLRGFGATLEGAMEVLDCGVSRALVFNRTVRVRGVEGKIGRLASAQCLSDWRESQRNCNCCFCE